jgi:CBS domain containing-hemolysin-like protein
MDEVPLSSIITRVLAVIGLITANAVFVSSQFALFASRRTHIDGLAEKGDKKAKLARKAITSLDRSISASQLGISLASIGLVWIAEPAVAASLQRAFGELPDPFGIVTTHGFAVAVTFLLLGLLHVVFGEFVPKAVALQHPHTTSRWLAAPLLGFAAVATPFIALLNAATNMVLRFLRMHTATASEHARHPEEILSLVKQSQASGHLDTQDVRLIEGVLEFTEKAAIDVMTPRTEVVALESHLTVEQAAARVGDQGRSRYPVVRDSLDDIVGIVHAKQILAHLSKAKDQRVDTIMQEPLFVPGSREIEDLLADMQRLKRHLAVVLDEYGGTAGIVTMEDLLEEIVGQIFDEYDESTSPPEPDPHATTLPGSMEIDEASERFGFAIVSKDYTTVGGYVFGVLGRLPRVGDRVSVGSATLEVVQMEDRRVGSLRVHSTG